MRSTVVVVGFCPDGKQITQEFVMDHPPQAGDSELLSRALTLVRGSGGMTVLGEKGSVDFYSMLHLVKMNFSVNKIMQAFTA